PSETSKQMGPAIDPEVTSAVAAEAEGDKPTSDTDDATSAVKTTVAVNLAEDQIVSGDASGVSADGVAENQSQTGEAMAVPTVSREAASSRGESDGADGAAGNAAPTRRSRTEPAQAEAATAAPKGNS